MAKRSLSAHGIRFTKKYKRGEEIELCPDDLGGKDLYSEFYNWASSLVGSNVAREDSNKVVMVNEVLRFSQRVIMVRMAVGSFGEEGPVLNHATMDSSKNIDEDEAPVAFVRGLLYVPVGDAKYAPFFTEHSIRGSGAGDLYSSFAKHWSKASKDARMRRDQLSSGEDWLEGARLKEVGFSFYREGKDSFDPIDASSGIQYYAFKARRGESLGEKLYRTVSRNPRIAGQLLGVDVPEGADISFTVTTAGGRTKTFDINDPDDVLGYREVLNNHGEPSLTDDELVERCSGITCELLEPTGQTWDRAWSD